MTDGLFDEYMFLQASKERELHMSKLTLTVKQIQTECIAVTRVTVIACQFSIFPMLPDVMVFWF